MQQIGVAASIKYFLRDGIDFYNQHLVTSVNTFPLEAWQNTYINTRDNNQAAIEVLVAKFCGKSAFRSLGPVDSFEFRE